MCATVRTSGFRTPEVGVGKLPLLLDVEPNAGHGTNQHSKTGVDNIRPSMAGHGEVGRGRNSSYNVKANQPEAAE